jgi:hypothetical protein
MVKIMAKYRPFFCKFWKDPDIQDLEPHEKLLFAYLFTCESTTTSGIYPITPKTIAHETGVDVEVVKKFLSNGSFKSLAYDNDNNYVFVKGFKKYNKGGAPNIVKSGIVFDYEKSRCTGLWSLFIEYYPEYKEAIIEVGNPKDFNGK